MTEDDLIYTKEVVEYFNVKMSDLLMKMVYPGVLTCFLATGDKFYEHLTNIARNSATTLLKIKIPKSNNLKTIVKHLMKLWGTKYKVKLKKDMLILSTKHCMLCQGMPEIDLREYHYCEIVGLFLESFLNELRKYKNPKKFKYSEFSITTTKSMGCGDEKCEYIIKFSKI